jgi:hypothetical protein
MTIRLVSFAAAATITLGTPVAVRAQAQTPKPASTEATATVELAKTSSSETVIVLQSTPKPEKSHRELAGHVFMPSHLIEDPFSYTAFGMTFGIGTGQALGPTITLDPPAITADSKWYGYTGMGMGFGMNIRFLEYLSARVGLGWTAYLGNGRDGLLVVGTNVKLLGDLGIKGSLPLGEHFRLAATVDARYGPNYNVLLAQGIIDAINSCKPGSTVPCQITGNQFFQETDTITWTFGLAASWAPWPFLGLTLNGAYLNPTKTGTSSVSENGLSGAAMLDFDFLPLVRWLPLGLNVTYGFIGPVGSLGVTTTQEFGFGFYYTGRKDLALGLELDWKIATLESQQATEATLAWINFRYYF